MSLSFLLVNIFFIPLRRISFLYVSALFRHHFIQSYYKSCSLAVSTQLVSTSLLGQQTSLVCLSPLGRCRHTCHKHLCLQANFVIYIHSKAKNQLYHSQTYSLYVMCIILSNASCGTKMHLGITQLLM